MKEKRSNGKLGKYNHTQSGPLDSRVVPLLLDRFIHEFLLYIDYPYVNIEKDFGLKPEIIQATATLSHGGRILPSDMCGIHTKLELTERSFIFHQSVFVVRRLTDGPQITCKTIVVFRDSQDRYVAIPRALLEKLI